MGQALSVAASSWTDLTRQMFGHCKDDTACNGAYLGPSRDLTRQRKGRRPGPVGLPVFDIDFFFGGLILRPIKEAETCTDIVHGPHGRNSFLG